MISLSLSIFLYLLYTVHIPLSTIVARSTPSRFHMSQFQVPTGVAIVTQGDSKADLFGLLDRLSEFLYPSHQSKNQYQTVDSG